MWHDTYRGAAHYAYPTWSIRTTVNEVDVQAYRVMRIPIPDSLDLVHVPVPATRPRKRTQY